jgi:hypothetical protein
MIDEVTIKSSRSAGELKLSDPKPPGSLYPVEYLRVSLKDKDIAASSAKIYGERKIQLTMCRTRPPIKLRFTEEG